MRENYGLYCWWDVKNNCFAAFSPDYELCRGIGETHVEAVAALDTDVQVWIKTGHDLGVDVLTMPPVVNEQACAPSHTPPKLQENADKEQTRKTRTTSLKMLREAMAAAQEAALSAIPLDYTVTLDPCVIRIRDEITLQTASGVWHEIMELASHQSAIIFDLSELDYIDSSGLALLVEVCKRLRVREVERLPQALLFIVVSSAKGNQVARVLRLGRFDTIMQILPSVEEAKAVLEESRMAPS